MPGKETCAPGAPRPRPPGRTPRVWGAPGRRSGAHAAPRASAHQNNPGARCTVQTGQEAGAVLGFQQTGSCGCGALALPLKGEVLGAGFPGPVLPAVRFLSHWELRLALLEYFDLDFEIFLYFLISYLADVAIGAVG